MFYAEPYKTRVAGDWLDDDHPGYPGMVVSTWSGGVCWLATREVAEQLVKDQDVMLAQLDERSRAENQNLHFDGDTLVCKPGPAFEDEDWEAEHVTPDEDGLYFISFGWTWSDVGEWDDPAQPTEVQLAAFNRFKEKAIFGDSGPVRIIDSMSRLANPDGTHVFPISVWDGAEPAAGEPWHTIHIANVAIDRDGNIKVERVTD